MQTFKMFGQRLGLQSRFEFLPGTADHLDTNEVSQKERPQNVHSLFSRTHRPNDSQQRLERTRSTLCALLFALDHIKSAD